MTTTSRRDEEMISMAPVMGATTIRLMSNRKVRIGLRNDNDLTDIDGARHD
ncbi:hypothetical protein F3Y22_tig00116997pilonHSYRG00106 [Hibiscus syriacus]|uniref:Uncharacterized protein n=1 Tax=Hibiscus syriacus TaxID=106335 RepID=A0A6A2WQT6_HIBSY|nr:hypothetical protein F3Y22_tig00116997pilonHSYRG00106 [Hibiscus syriacus]